MLIQVNTTNPKYLIGTQIVKLSNIPHPLNHDLVDEMAETEFERLQRLAREHISAPSHNVRGAVGGTNWETETIGESSISNLRNK